MSLLLHKVIGCTAVVLFSGTLNQFFRLGFFAGVRRGLHYVLDYKKEHEGIFMQLEVHCYSDVAWDVLDYVFCTAKEKVTSRKIAPYSELRMGTIGHLCGFRECMPEMWRSLILDIFNLFVELLSLFYKLRGCGVEIISAADNEAGTRAAEFMANRQITHARFKESGICEYAVNELKPDDVFPEQLKEILYENFYRLHVLPYSARVRY